VTSTNTTLCTSSQLQENWAVPVVRPRDPDPATGQRRWRFWPLALTLAGATSHEDNRGEGGMAWAGKPPSGEHHDARRDTDDHERANG
jgi:hypothetical protein